MPPCNTMRVYVCNEYHMKVHKLKDDHASFIANCSLISHEKVYEESYLSESNIEDESWEFSQEDSYSNTLENT